MDSRAGFTLIEVVGALLIFSVALGAVIQFSGALGRQLEYAAVTTEITSLARQKVDSLEDVGFAGLSTGSAADQPSVRGRTYDRVWSVTAVHPLLYEIDVSVTPSTGSGPRVTLESYLTGSWR